MLTSSCCRHDDIIVLMSCRRHRADVMLTSLTRILTRSGRLPDPAGSDRFDRLNTRSHAPRLSAAREGASDVRFGRSWYRRARIEMLYNVVYLFYMFEAFTDSKIHIEPYVRVFLEYFCVFSCISLWFRKYVW